MKVVKALDVRWEASSMFGVDLHLIMTKASLRRLVLWNHHRPV